MYGIEIHPIIFPSLVSLFLLYSITKYFCKSSRNNNPPPSPRKLPIIGNLHQLGSLPYRNLQLLARKHGPLMLLHFGSVPVLIVSSADAACEIFRNHDLCFSDRPLHKVPRTCFYDGKDVALSPYGEYWRHGRSIFTLKLLSNKKVQSFRIVREEETTLFVKKIGESLGREVNLSEMICQFSNDLICRSAFGNKFSEQENGKEFLRLVNEIPDLLGEFCIGDFIPWLSWVDRVSGLDERANKVAKGLDNFVENTIKERLKSPELKKNGENFVDIMLEIYNDNAADVSIDKDCIKAIILDVLAAGTGTLAAALGWLMTELLANPTVMKKLQYEVREIVKLKNVDITDDDLKKMHYLQAVIKENFRLHPPFPLLVPRMTRNDVIVKGYNVSAGTTMMVNAWAIGREPATWDEPEKFKPERFLNSSVDFKGLDFKLIPFGAGRRGCPGITYSTAAIELLLTNLILKFDWKLPEEKRLDMSEKPGMTAHKVVPLYAVAIKTTLQ